ncbi:hypothetical protein ACU80C_30630 (plasmid) [Bacillus mycoides]|uniref:Uncharacterized protein n=2 Tax=Bacillus cereus group TaxID=86661 RepID=A0A1E8AY46_BACMY|nr:MULTISPECIES: hypothetical protein [Bacillus cereus group]MED0887244.1 hypothetical protein [Bacillus mycoides]MED0929793.1 hypothetical protein [Bacillus mycoides]OFD69819.1 hypothetical protein BWGOE9_58710 [Bacillus mycoides]OFD69971.1 hypothetical protein BWGOE8_58520 [Bacillus mycoides]OFD82407.1 hypothetical protein BWGOE10_23590 [Bacillus mycoides]
MEDRKDEYNIRLLCGFLFNTSMWIMMHVILLEDYDEFPKTHEFIKAYIINPTAILGYVALTVLWVRHFIKKLKKNRETKNKKINLDKE